ncbi:zinc finger protein 91 [Wyeomyia smithii]|uniref:zinc finger protein 91 n=1 Tax=Wyeomyia smithii TaxID=174621 RepID=UPI002467E7EA|nr:zinc finger protein 91 [Wyeomyia smithii]
MCTKTLSCPLCCQSNFPNIDALRISLLKVTSRPLKCPICAEQLLGLDKLTIHLFGHSILGQEEERAPVVEEKKKPTITASLKNVRKPKKEATVISAGVINNGNFREKQSVNKVKCDICAEEFSDKNFLKMHKSVFHEISTVSSRSPPKTSQETGMTIEEPKDLFQCSMCPKAFRMKGSLKIHIRCVHLGCQKKGTLSSNGCATPQSTVTSTTTTSAYHYQDVMQFDMQNSNQVMSTQTQPQLAPLTSTVSIAPSMGQAQIIKILDPRQLAEFIYVANHQQQAVECPAPNASPPSAASPAGNFSDIPSPSQASPQSLGTISETNKQWECDVCLKSFTTKYFLKKHKRLHTGEMPYSCQICGKSFTFQQSYHKHLLYHSDEKPHICTVCNRAFKELSTLHNHERIHSGEKPFSCETCGKCFRQRVSYLVHRRIHTNTQPYKCTACDKSFRYKVSQRTHKCPAQPPGTVVRQTGDLLQKLLQSSAILPTLHDAASPMTDSEPPHSIESTDQSEPQEIKSEDYINRTLDELFNESYDKMGIGHPTGNFGTDQDQPRQLLYDSSNHRGDSQNHSTGTGESAIVPRIENLCLLSPDPQDVIAFDGDTMEVIDSIKLDLLYN